MTDLPLPLGPDGYVDLTVFPDGDPDAVLDPDALSSLHDALVAEGDGGSGAIDDGLWDQLVDSVVSGDPGVDIADILIPGVVSDGPFDLSDYPAVAATAEGEGDDGAADDVGDTVHDQIDDALDAAGQLTDDRDPTDMVDRDDHDGDGDHGPDLFDEALGDDLHEPGLLGDDIDDLSPFDDDPSPEVDDLDDF